LRKEEKEEKKKERAFDIENVGRKENTVVPQFKRSLTPVEAGGGGEKKKGRIAVRPGERESLILHGGKCSFIILHGEKKNGKKRMDALRQEKHFSSRGGRGKSSSSGTWLTKDRHSRPRQGNEKVMVGVLEIKGRRGVIVNSMSKCSTLCAGGGEKKKGAARLKKDRSFGGIGAEIVFSGGFLLGRRKDPFR